MDRCLLIRLSETEREKAYSIVIRGGKSLWLQRKMFSCNRDEKLIEKKEIFRSPNETRLLDSFHIII